MSWDFSTDPDFQQKLDWMNEFVRSEIWPLETVWRELGHDGLREAMTPLQQEVRERGLWATHLPPELGGQGMGQVPTMEHPWEQSGGYGGHAEISYEGVRVGADALLGAVGEAFVIAQHRLGPGRIHHCMRWLGVARRAFDMMCERATYRHAHGSLLADKQTVQNWIADSAAEMQAARLMTLHAAWVMDTQGASAARVDISLIKFFGAKVLHDVIDRALQVHGSLGYSTDLPLEQMYRFARGARFYDGPDEVHRQTVAKRILAGYSPPPDEVPSEHLPTRREQARERFAHLLGALTAND